MQEEFLRKLSKSGYEDNLILKGGLFIYTLTNFESRATIDVDFLLRGFSNSIEDVKSMIGKIIETSTGNDFVSMTAKGFEEISPQRKYHGISTQIIGQINKVFLFSSMFQKLPPAASLPQNRMFLPDNIYRKSLSSCQSIQTVAK